MKCVFCEFAKKKRKKHSDGMPFKIIHKTKQTISFLSNVILKKEEGHILVIPKKHYANLEDVSTKTNNELINHVKLLAKVLRKNHGGCNILLNDGGAAGQTVFHVHFHLIPRDNGDNIKIEVFKRKKMSKTDFLNLHNKIKRAMLSEVC